MSQPSLDAMQDKISQAAEAYDMDSKLAFKPMFGGVCAYVGGRVFASLSDVGLALKLPPDVQEELLQVPEARRLQYDPASPPSKQYVVVPPPVLSDKPA